MNSKLYVFVVLMLTAVSPRPAAAQFVGSHSRPTAATAAVEYLFPEQIAAPAGKATEAVLHFRVAPGLHINSHAPNAPDLVPTALSFPAASGVRLESADYPPGASFAFAIDPKHPLSVYTGEFVVKARIVAAPGGHLVEARLRYQACDQNACMPPRTVVAPISVIGR